MIRNYNFIEHCAFFQTLDRVREDDAANSTTLSQIQLKISAGEFDYSSKSFFLNNLAYKQLSPEENDAVIAMYIRQTLCKHF